MPDTNISLQEIELIFIDILWKCGTKSPKTAFLTVLKKDSEVPVHCFVCFLKLSAGRLYRSSSSTAKEFLCSMAVFSSGTKFHGQEKQGVESAYC